jgi:hypothetical protein
MPPRDGGRFNRSCGTAPPLVAATSGSRLMFKPLLTVAVEELHNLPLQHESLEAVPEIDL